MSTFPKAVIAAVLFVLLAFLGALSFGGVVVTERQGVHELRQRGGPLVATFATYAECKAAIPDPAGPMVEEWTCKENRHVEKLGVCDPISAPVVDAEGFTVEEPVGPPELCPDGIHYRATQLQYPLERIYPNCGKVPVEVLSCVPPTVVMEYDDPAHPPLSEMVLDPVGQPGR